MNERESPLELVPDQQMLAEAWKNLAEALVLHAQQIGQPTDVLPVQPDAPLPYTFTHVLDQAFVREHLLDDGLHAVSSAKTEYITPHRMEEDGDVMDVIEVRWKAHMPRVAIAINHSITLERIVSDGAERYVGFVWEEYVERSPDGREEWRISRSGYEFPKDGFNYDSLLASLRDRSGDIHDIGVDEIEKIHKITGYLRAKHA